MNDKTFLCLTYLEALHSGIDRGVDQVVVTPKGRTMTVTHCVGNRFFSEWYIELAERFSEKAVLRKFEELERRGYTESVERRGYTESGVSARTGWLTPKGKIALAKERLRREILEVQALGVVL